MTVMKVAHSVRGRVAILYHFMHPDDVVSALHFDGLAQDLAEKGWQVEAICSNRGCRDETKSYSRYEVYRGVHYLRVWRPRFSQFSFHGRLCNSLWMIVAWSMLAGRLRAHRPDVVVIGTDPVFAAIAAIPLRVMSPKIKLVHWCFDLHPEAAIAGGLVRENSLAVRLTRAVMRSAYSHFDVIADLGSCMRKLLRRYEHRAKELELTPWALVEPPQPVERHAGTRKELFGDARIGILYSGNFGEAHNFETVLTLARSMREISGVRFCFAVRGNRAEELRQAVTKRDNNISFAKFAPIEELEKRLGSADIHFVSLRDEWAGIAVPSKFFGSMATGRPVLYSGPRDSAIGEWIISCGLGWIVDNLNIEEIAQSIAMLVDAPSELSKIQEHCHTTYRKYFSRQIITDKWDRELQILLHNRNGVS